MTRAAWDVTLTDYQARLLLAALADSQHRIPSDARARTLDIMRRNQWIRPRRLAFVEGGVKDWRLTHHGVNAANRVRTAQLAKQYPAGSGAVYVPEGATERDVVVVDSGPDKDGTVQVLSAKQGGKALRVALAALQPLPELAPEPEGEWTEWWTVMDRTGQEVARVEGGLTRTAAMKVVEADPVAGPVSRREGGVGLRRLRTSELSIPVGELHGLPRISPAPAARVDWWAVKGPEGNLITQVEATSYDHAVQVADQDPKVRAAALGAGGLVYTRLDSIEKPARTAPPATPARFCTDTVPARRTITVTTGFTRKSIPTRLRESNAPGRMVNSEAAGGALRWRLPDGEELTQGEAAKRFLGD
ncbi:hypothetical protein [Streptomyces sp. NPDC059455]|uniref:hypothetical protein n=1 Tax=Streptomyces sp. NPDC059455 TaxID=3346837 RepID=UPI0036BD8041